MLPETLHADVGQEREHVEAAALEGGNGGGQRIGLVDDVGVDEEQQLAARAKASLVQRPRLAEPAGRRLLAVDDGEARIVDGARGGAGAVGRAVVDHDQLEVAIGRGKESTNRRGDDARLIARRDDDRDQGLRVGHPAPQARNESEIEEGAEEREHPEEEDEC